MDTNTDTKRCDYPKCKEFANVGYYNKWLCNDHWSKLCDKPTSEMKEILGVRQKKVAISEVPVEIPEEVPSISPQ